MDDFGTIKFCHWGILVCCSLELWFGPEKAWAENYSRGADTCFQWYARTTNVTRLVPLEEFAELNMVHANIGT